MVWYVLWCYSLSCILQSLGIAGRGVHRSRIVMWRRRKKSREVGSLRVRFGFLMLLIIPQSLLPLLLSLFILLITVAVAACLAPLLAGAVSTHTGKRTKRTRLLALALSSTDMPTGTTNPRRTKEGVNRGRKGHPSGFGTPTPRQEPECKLIRKCGNNRCRGNIFFV